MANAQKKSKKSPDKFNINVVG